MTFREQIARWLFGVKGHIPVISKTQDYKEAVLVIGLERLRRVSNPNEFRFYDFFASAVVYESAAQARERTKTPGTYIVFSLADTFTVQQHFTVVDGEPKLDSEVALEGVREDKY